MALSQRDQMAKNMKASYANAAKTGTLGVGFGGPAPKKVPAKTPAKKTPVKPFNAGGSFTKQKKKMYGTK